MLTCKTKKVVVLGAVCAVLLLGNSARAGEAERLAAENARLKEQVKVLVSFVRLVNDTMPKLMEMQSLGESMQKTMKQLDGFPDAEHFKSQMRAHAASIRGITKATEEFGVFLEENGATLRAAGLAGDMLDAPPANAMRELDKLAGVMEGVAAGTRSAEWPTYAKQDWQVSNISVSKGDVVFVSSEGEWTLSPNLPAVSGSGLSRAEAERIAAGIITFSRKTTAQKADEIEKHRIFKANRGCLLVRVLGSEAIHAPVGGRFIADASGPLQFRTNDTDLSNNSKICRARVVVIERSRFEALMRTGGALLPTSRQAALKVRCALNLKQIGFGCHLYSGDHGERFPATLNALFPDLIPERLVFSCPETPAAMSYGYVAGLRPTAPATCVLAFDRRGNHEGGRNVLPVGGNVVWMTEAQFQAAHAKTLQWMRDGGSAE